MTQEAINKMLGLYYQYLKKQDKVIFAFPVGSHVRVRAVELSYRAENRVKQLCALKDWSKW